jgi:hypothetical protein
MKLKKYTVLLMLVVFGCSIDSSWNTYQNTGIKKYHQMFTDIYFPSPTTGYLAGFDISAENDDDNFGFYYKTNDGGKSWKRQIIGKGQVKQVVESANQIFVNEIIPAGDTYSSYLQISEDSGETWKTLFKTDPETTIYKIFPYNKGVLAVTAKIENNRITNNILSITGNSLKNIGQIFNIGSYYSLQLANDNLCYLENGKYLKTHNIKTQEEHNVTYPSAFKIQAITQNHNGNFHAIGTINDLPTILQITTGNNPLKIQVPEKYRGLSVGGASVYNSSITLLVHTHASILGVSKKLLVSRDNGQNWSDVKIPFSLICSPFTFYKDQFFIAHNGDSRIIKRVNKNNS